MRTSFLTAATLAFAITLGAGAAQAFTVLCGESACGPGDTNATAIRNLEIFDTVWDVDFRFASANDIWGSSGPFDFPTFVTAATAGRRWAPRSTPCRTS